MKISYSFRLVLISKSTTGFAGVSSFTGYDPWNVYSCAQPDESSIYSIVNMLHSQGDEALEIIWVNLREEPSMLSIRIVFEA